MYASEAFDFQDIMILPASTSRVASRKDVNLINNDGYVPISAANMEGVGTFSMARALTQRKWQTYIHKHYTPDEWHTFLSSMENLDYVVPTIGSSQDDLVKLVDLQYPFKKICIDVANGHSVANMDQIKRVREAFPDAEIVYGNVANVGVLEYMEENDILPDYIKVGIGSGSVCTTRLKTGIGLSQASAIYDFACYTISNGINVNIISDGGCRNPGDVVKAYMLGAHEVMLGGMLAYTEESERVIGSDVDFTGSSHRNSKFFSDSKYYATSEGLETRKPCVGSVLDIVDDVEGGIRSAFSYLDLRSIDDMYRLQEIEDPLDQLRIVRRQTDNYS